MPMISLFTSDNYQMKISFEIEEIELGWIVRIILNVYTCNDVL